MPADKDGSSSGSTSNVSSLSPPIRQVEFSVINITLKPPQPLEEAKDYEYKPEDFDNYYLKKITSEFADDLDRVRSSGDFGDKSLPILIAALKQGSSIYSEEEKRMVMGALK